jgi:hypothetical protein
MKGWEVGEGLLSEAGDGDVSADERVVAMEGSPGSSGSILCSDVVCLHNIQLRFDFAVLRSSVEEVLGRRARCRYVEESRQLVCRLEWSGKKLTFLFNERSGGQIFLKASNDPLTLWEFVAFAEYFLPGIFTALTGRLITPNDFYIVRPPELNIDLPGVHLKDVKEILLSDYLTHLRVYLKKIGDAMFTRVEAWSEELAGQRLTHLIHAVKTTMSNSEMIKFLAEIAKKHEELKEEIKEIKSVLEKLVGAFETTKPEKRSDVSFNDLPKELQTFLLILSTPEYAYIRIRYDAIEFGENYWQGMKKWKHNFGIWLKEELLVWPENLKPVLRSIFSAIYFYNRQFNNKGVPWDLWLKEFEKRLEEEGLSLEETIERIKKYLEQKTKKSN